ncbi:MAG: phosphate/phosphite/phosphonate ABC transporter substrate-binding protein [Acidimicrobiia bacterium]
MNRRPRMPRMVLFVLPVVVVAAACGSGGDSGAEAAGGEVSGEPEMLIRAPIADEVTEGLHYRPPTLRFASVSGADEEATTDRYAELVEHLAAELGMEVDYIETTDYSSVIEAMRAGRVDVATYGPFSYVIASTEANALSLVAQPNQETGELGYQSLIITNAASDITTLEDLKGRSMAFADPASTSGHLFPRLILAEAGITDLDAYFSERIFSGGHDASLVAVANNQIDAAGVCSTCIERYYREGLAKPEDVRVIAESETIPPSPVAVRADLDPELRQEITDVFLDLLDEAPEIMARISRLDEAPTHPYVPVADADYDVIRRLAEELDVDLAELD